ncbi:MAG: lipid A biosynthesis lauroyl acyltransferase [Gammaproteobacteria bacterium]|jgi:KDO2-lipid IV(A) lauroyltransferase
MNDSSNPSLSRFLAPRFWPTWILLGVMRLSAVMPITVQLGIGTTLGWLFRKLKRREVRIARRNLEICLPELDAEQRARLLERHFRSVGLSVVEMGVGWFTPIDKLRRRVDIIGLGNLESALSRGHGALLLTAHFTPIEVGVGVLEGFPGTINSMYRPQRNPMMDCLILRGRSRFSETQIPRDNVRLLVRLLRQNQAVLYMPDQTYLGNQSALIPFFGEPAVTNIATSKIAKISGAPVLPYFFRRNADERSYTVEIGEPLEDFPTDDAIADTRRIVELLERRIRETPEQYLWVYKKFKRRPTEFADIYAEPVE